MKQPKLQAYCKVVSKIVKSLGKRIFKHETSFLGEDLQGGRREVFYCAKHCFSVWKYCNPISLQHRTGQKIKGNMLIIIARVMAREGKKEG